jgi:RNA-binding protein
MYLEKFFTPHQEVCMDKQFKKTLKAKCHHLDTVVRLGSNGLTEAVHAEIDLALNVHELIKIKLVGDKEMRQELAQTIANQQGAEIIHAIGHQLCLYRKKEEA